MTELEALRLALYLFHVPSGVKAARAQPLPKGIPHLLEIAAGDDQVTSAAALKLERTTDVLREAAGFFIEQILLAPDCNSYRTLGGRRDSSDAELRRNMALLLRWLHPDLDRAGARSIYAGRVTQAWETLKTPDRRTSYDAANPPRPVKSKSQRRTGNGSGQKAQPPHIVPAAAKAGARTDIRPGAGGIDDHPGLIRRTLRYMFGRQERRR